MILIIRNFIYILFFLFIYCCSDKDNSSYEMQDSNLSGSKELIVDFKTNLGEFSILLDEMKAPKTVKNFLNYVENDFYDNTIFHRVINNFMIQGGGFDSKMNKKTTNKPIINEANNGLLNEVGTIAMARTSSIDSATSQFFINVSDNNFLNHRGPGPSFGYAVFGKVIRGYEIIELIKSVETKPLNGHRDVPIEPVIIENVSLRR